MLRIRSLLIVVIVLTDVSECYAVVSSFIIIVSFGCYFVCFCFFPLLPLYAPFFVKLQQCRSDYAFHGYGEVCNFLEDYKGVAEIAAFGVVPIERFLIHCDFGRELSASMTGEMRDFRKKCLEFIDRIVFVLLESVTVTSGVARMLHSFCPDIILGGDDRHVFELFSSLCQLLGYATCYSQMR